MGDLISRQAAIEALKRAEALTRAFGYQNVIETIRDLPTAEPEIIRCKDCRWWDRDWIPAYGDGHYCPMIDFVTNDYFFCYYAEPEAQSCS